MTVKRWEIIDEEFISYTAGPAQLISNGECEIHLWEIPKDAQLFCDKLNAINEENEQLEEAREYYQENFLTMKTERNQFKRENEQLKEEIEFAKLLANHRGEMVSFADSLIQDIDDEFTQKMWHQFKEEMYQKWKKKRE